ncbi:diguanylate cyclase (GGDEF) domain-containing protein [Cellulomonas marina]|uniref:Diguanylate cyclase (GGDEF) domain-containing protein n=1 Tax=Cellulomonas marina TaxID=988821 RepID=A0A1I0Z7E1_9CELL|nr:diguanylate cyclase (GGDEF) domain-containing protein [Cellulomonas marina]
MLLLAAVLGLTATVGWEVVAWLTGRPDSTAVSAATALLSTAPLGVCAWVAARRADRVPAPVWLALAALQPLAVAVMSITARDVSVSGQLGFAYPAVFAASQFRRRVAALVTAECVVADAAVVLTLQPVGPALQDLLVVTCGLVTVAGVLVLSNARQDGLVARLDALASLDPLTGLASRRGLEDAAARTLATLRADDPAGRLVVGLLVLDLDHFKTLNDTFGHPVGDAALVHLADVVRGVVGPSDVVARLGGDELAVLVRGTPGTVDARAVAVHAAVTATELPHVGRWPLSVSVGYACAAPHRASFGSLYRAADEALYRAKRQGRDQVVAAGPVLDDEPPPAPGSDQGPFPPATKVPGVPSPGP